MTCSLHLISCLSILLMTMGIVQSASDKKSCRCLWYEKGQYDDIQVTCHTLWPTDIYSYFCQCNMDEGNTVGKLYCRSLTSEEMVPAEYLEDEADVTEGLVCKRVEGGYFYLNKCEMPLGDER